MNELLSLVRDGWTLHLEPVDGFRPESGFHGSIESSTGARYVQAFGSLEVVIEQLLEGSKKPTPVKPSLRR